MLSFLKSTGNGNHGVIFLLNHGPKVANVHVRTPLITSGQAVVNDTLVVAPGEPKRLDVLQVTSLSSEFPFIEDKGAFIWYIGHNSTKNQFKLDMAEASAMYFNSNCNINLILHGNR